MEKKLEDLELLVSSVKKIKKRPQGPVALVHEGVPYIGDLEQMSELYRKYFIAVGVTPDRTRVDICAGFRDYHVPPTVPLWMRGSFDGEMKVIELYGGSHYKACCILHDKDSIQIIMEKDDKSLYAIDFKLRAISVLGEKKEKKTLFIDELVE